jgi:pimeloyl-ACP methyl ester carboxylesterase
MFRFTLRAASLAAFALACSSADAASRGQADAESAGSEAFVPGVLDARLPLGGKTLDVTWYLPEAESRGFVVLMHGFSRNKGHMRDLAGRLRDRSLVVLAPNVGLGAINDTSFLERMADDVSALTSVPGTTFALPERIVFAGHSAGGKNAALMAAHLRVNLGERLMGVMLLDPVEREGQLEQSLVSLDTAGVEILSLLAKPGSCNAGGNAAPLLKRLPVTFKGLLFANGTHCDAEGSTSDFVCKLACGASHEKTVVSTQEFAVHWVDGFFAGRTPAYFPGGEVLGDALRDKLATLLE